MCLVSEFAQSIIAQVKCFWAWVMKFLNKDNNFKKGSIILCPGFHKLGVGTCKNPVAVYLDVQEPCDGVTTCVGNLNWVVAKLHPCGQFFTIFADIKTESCTVNYIVEY